MFDLTSEEIAARDSERRRAEALEALDAMDPGPFLAMVLSGIDPDALNGEDRVTVMQAYQRLASHYTACTYEAMASIVDAYQDEYDAPFHKAAEAAAYELRPALRLTRRAADTELGLALDLRDRLPRVFASLSAGLIDQRRARTIIWQTTHLNDDEARSVVDRIIDQAPDLTTGQLMARIRKLCVEVQPEAAVKRYNRAVTDRNVQINPTDAGTANLCVYDLEPEKAIAAGQRIDQIARTLRTDGETRSMDQLRADVAVDLLLGKDTSGKGSTIDLRVDLDTLAELDNHSGDLAGYGPVVADIARKVVAERTDGQWRYTVTHQGRPIATGTTKRRPTKGQQRHVEAANPTCVFPGCRMPATQCDIDHRIDWAHTRQTNTEDLWPLCEHDHTGKHRHGWFYRTLPDGDTEWRSPLGKRYVTGGPPP